jgi:dissimilatory sulfite reductase (desulfoviridin) alpha/beta subunit
MSQWVYRGLKTGIVTTRYPKKADRTPGVTPGLPKCSGSFAPGSHELEAICPTKAIAAGVEHIFIDYRKCVHCYRCQRETEHPWNGVPTTNGQWP